MIHQAKASYLDGVNPKPRSGRLVYDSENRELHFYESQPGDGGAIKERFVFTLDKNHTFEIRSRGTEQTIEWRVAGNHTSEMLTLSDLPFIRLVRDKFLENKNIFWRYATLVWSESLGKVLIALTIAVFVTGLGAWFFMQNSYHLIPNSWDKKIGDQAEPGLKEFGVACASPQTVKDLKKFLPYFIEPGTPFKYDIQIVKSPVENAFALPGGKIMVFSKTVSNAETYAELAGILAHEVAHVEHRHGMQQLSQYMTIRLVLALAFGMTDDATMLAYAADAGAILLLLKNSRDHERDADAYAAAKLAQAGISSKAIRNFFERISREHKKELSKIPDFVLTHPADDDRIKFFERYEAKHKSRLKAAARKLSPEVTALLGRKPVLAAECIAPKAEEATDSDEEDETD